ncbi:Ras- protein rsr1 [Tulasnella sp. JGI-2019a]|nr:Ras- protein rsr1 [Tulasnella sp. JGI-2019a]KAG9016481.1 Ras- protein rsr1 [Tulasnella sp. JGI-2019a]KAG9023786.1 Ras- protein rsr1 [Tulasnella sp. JGI-2019a]
MMKVDDEICLLDVLDTAGAEQFGGLSEHYIHLTQESSIREIEALRWQIHRIKGLSPPPGQPTSNSPDLPIVVVATKSDLIGEREVGRDVLHQITAMWGCPIFETSAKNNWNINEVFEDIVRQMRTKIPDVVVRRREKDKKKKDPKCIIT